MHPCVVWFIWKHKQKYMCLFSICLLSTMWKSACQCHKPSLYHTCSLGADSLFFFFFLFFPSIFVKPWKAAPESMPLPGRCSRATVLRHPPWLQHWTSFAVLLHSLLLLLRAPDWESFQETCLRLLAVETDLKAEGGFFFFFLSEQPLLADNGRYVYAESVFCTLRD